MTASDTASPAQAVNRRIAEAIRGGGERMALASPGARHSFADVAALGDELLMLLEQGGCGADGAANRRGTCSIAWASSWRRPCRARCLTGRWARG